MVPTLQMETVMESIQSLIERLQKAGLVVQGSSIEKIGELMKNDRRPPGDQIVALLSHGRGYGIYFYQDQAAFDRDEFIRTLGEAGLSSTQAKAILGNLRCVPAPELSRVGDRD